MASRAGDDSALWGMKEANIIVLQEENCSQYCALLEDLDNESAMSQ